MKVAETRFRAAASAAFPCCGLTLLLLVLGIFANDHHMTLALDDLALFAHGLNGRSHFHLDCLLTAVGQDLLRQVIRPLVRS